jgi:hypothetical protein
MPIKMDSEEVSTFDVNFAAHIGKKLRFVQYTFTVHCILIV